MMDLTIVGVSKAYGQTRVLNDISLHVPAGSLTAILGPSGCGKTTLLRLIAGFARPDSGTIQLGDRALNQDGVSVPPERRRIGYVAQEGALFPHLTVAANVTFGLPRRARSDMHRVTELLDLVGLDPGYGSRYPDQLSGGQQQRVALARALAPEPSVILLDEPFASLDAGLRDGTRRAVARTLAAAGTTAILVTHDQAEALSLAHQVAVLRRGHLAQVAAPADLYRAPVDIETARFVGEAIILRGRVQNGSVDCALGSFAVPTDSPDGPVDVLIRPEQILLDAPGAPGGTPATVTETTYYGHDAAVRLELPDGTTVSARPPGYAAPRVGQRVSLSVRGDVHVFAARPAVQHLEPDQPAPMSFGVGSHG